MEDSFKLIYILSLSENWDGNNVYQFLFTKEDNLEMIENISDDWGWSNYPASNTPLKPDPEMVVAVGTIKTDRTLDLIQESDTFSVWDAMDGVTSIAWEDLTEYEIYPDFRLYFRYGESIKDVKSKLYKVDINLDFKKVGDEI
jgi:hypothetical protein